MPTSRVPASLPHAYDDVRLPPPVVAGDRVGVAALSGPVDCDRLDAGLRALEALGYRPVEAANLRCRQGLFAGDEADRLAAFHQLAADPDIRAIFFARGGWGVPRLLGGIDWPLLARHPRAYIGYSDLTPLLLEIVRRLRLATFHGPMVAAELADGLDAGEQESLVDALAAVSWPMNLPVSRALGKRASGVIEAPLIGGCLSLLASSIGTPFAADVSGCLLFLEDLNEPPYRFDRMLTHLRLSGTLADIRGMILGHLAAEGEPEASAWRGEVTLRSVAIEAAEQLAVPLVTDLAAGHARPNYTIPMGCQARLDLDRGRLTVGLAATGIDRASR